MLILSEMIKLAVNFYKLQKHGKQLNHTYYRMHATNVEKSNYLNKMGFVVNLYKRSKSIHNYLLKSNKFQQ